MEFFGWREFKNDKQIGTLAGLTPTPYDSGGYQREQGIGKDGNKRVRTLAVEMARELENIEFDRHERIQKTFVTSRRSLSFLDSISDEYDAPRDAVVEYSARRLLPIIAKERKKHEIRKEL
jgi:hypothetical protein